jgi:hypothetical protein
MKPEFLLFIPLLALVIVGAASMIGRKTVAERTREPDIFPTEELCEDGNALAGRRHVFDPLLDELDKRDYHSGG